MVAEGAAEDRHRSSSGTQQLLDRGGGEAALRCLGSGGTELAHEAAGRGSTAVLGIGARDVAVEAVVVRPQLACPLQPAQRLQRLRLAVGELRQLDQRLHRVGVGLDQVAVDLDGLGPAAGLDQDPPDGKTCRERVAFDLQHPAPVPERTVKVALGLGRLGLEDAPAGGQRPGGDKLLDQAGGCGKPAQ